MWRGERADLLGSLTLRGGCHCSPLHSGSHGGENLCCQVSLQAGRMSVLFFSSRTQPNQFQNPRLSKPRRVGPGNTFHIFKVKTMSLECQEVSGSKIHLGSEEKTRLFIRARVSTLEPE